MKTKKLLILILAILFAVSCEKPKVVLQVSDVTFTECNDEVGTRNLTDNSVVVEFTNYGVHITHYGLVVNCAFDTVIINQIFENGVLTITERGEPNNANCMCHTDVSYTISGISEGNVNTIVINGVVVWTANQQSSNCDQNVIISQTEYNNAPNHHISIISMQIVDNCLKIKFSASGCSGDNWVVKLIDSGMIAESLPCQRSLRLSLNDIGLCDAYFEKEISFNIEDLQIQGNHSVLLNIPGNSILYEY